MSYSPEYLGLISDYSEAEEIKEVKETTPKSELKLDTELTKDTVSPIAVFVESYLINKYDFSGATCADVLKEALTNIVEHAYPKEHKGRAVIKVHKDSKIIVTVRDFGVGMKDLEKCLQPFYARDKAASGMGFTIMQAFSANLEVSSKPKKGTEVRISFELE